MDTNADIAIIGGGSVGVSFLAQLVNCLQQEGDRIKHPATILLFEPRQRPGAGDAYHDDLPSNLLNIPVRNMSAFANDKAHFHRWLSAQPASVLSRFMVEHFDDSAFLPRPLFGLYMESVFEEAVAECRKSGFIIQHVAQRVVGLCESENGDWRVLVDGSRRYTAKRVVLCNGNLPSTAFPTLDGLARYFNAPYPVSKLAHEIEQSASVGIIGSSLSAVDAIVALRESGHRGEIICVSRNGRLPSVRSKLNRTKLERRLTAEDVEDHVQANGGELTLESFFSLLVSHLEALGGRLDMADVLGPDLPAHSALDHEIAVSQEQERLWQVVCSASNDVIDIVWQRLSEEQRLDYHRKWRSLWMARRATFPLMNALKLQAYFRQHTLKVLPGFTACSHDPRAQAFFIHRSKTGLADTRQHNHESLKVDYVINATSFSLDPSNTRDGLIAQLLEAGYISSDPSGGARLDYNTGCVMDTSGKVQRNLSLLGSLAAGTYFWTLSMDINARLAQAQAQRISIEMAREAVPVRDIDNFDMLAQK